MSVEEGQQIPTDVVSPSFKLGLLGERDTGASIRPSHCQRVMLLRLDCLERTTYLPSDALRSHDAPANGFSQWSHCKCVRVTRWMAPFARQ